MTRVSTDPNLVPRPVRLARPLIRAFVRSAHCPAVHRWHARSTLPVLALFVSMMEEEPDAPDLPWAHLDPDALVEASLDADPSERAFLRDLLEVSAAFYDFLAAEGRVPPRLAEQLRARLAALELGAAA